MALPVATTNRLRDLSQPAEFQRVGLRRRLWARQRELVTAAATERSTSVKGCHASGKTFAIAGAVLHHLALYEQGKVITIAPTLRQVKLVWEEIELARRGGIIEFPECTTTGLRITEERYGLGFSSSKGVNAQGLHGKEVLIITDESPGISADIWDAIDGVAAGGRVRRVKLGNPTVPSGPFYDDFTRHRALTKCITVSAFDTPNLQNPQTGKAFTIEELQALPADQLEYNPVPYLVTRWWVLDKFVRWGPTNPRYQSRVLGEFPAQSEHAVFDLSWIERARREPSEAELTRAQGCVIQVGIDVAAGGDDETTACARVNGIVLKRGSWSEQDPRGKVMRWLADLRFLSYPTGPVVVDAIGVGYNFAKHLADNGFDVYGFNAQRAAMDSEQFENSKAEAYFWLREMYKADYVSHLAEGLDEETEAQLSGVLYFETSRGKVMIEPKPEARKRGLSSPDRAEAQILAFCRVQPRSQVVVFGEPVQISPI